MVGAAEVWGIQSISGDSIVIRMVQQVAPKSGDDVARAIRAEVAAALKTAKLPLASSGVTVNLKK
jgi:small conductance mechanosensitive channel